MDIHMSKVNSRANLFRAPRLPDDLTDQLKEKILNLPGSVKTDYLKEEIFSKFVSKDTDPADLRRQRAIAKWLAAEEVNSATIDRLILTPLDYNILPRVTFESFVDFCRDLIVDIIGDTPPIEALIGSFSGGASTSRSRTSSHPANKYLGTAHATSRGLSTFLDIVPEIPGWVNAQTSRHLAVTIVPGNVLFTVPKKTDIDRVACKEPDLNMFVQKGIGHHFRGCLKRIGINLNDQSINRSLAQRGSQTGSLATLDLSSASDSICSELVFLLLPVTWYTLLDSVRSPVTIIDGEEHLNQMFSSMGNGFTFELQSLLFYTLMRATCYFTGTPGVVSVYGDDLIIPTEVAQLATWVLKYFGFSVNPDKSHTSGPIRESCGGHYWNGVDITPFYIKAPISSYPELIDVANKLRKWGTLSFVGTNVSIIDPDIEDIWLWLKAMVPSCLWGGVDTTFRYQLVSLDTPHSRLFEDTKRYKTGHGGYLHWLNTTWDRTSVYSDKWIQSTSAEWTQLREFSDPVVTSSRSEKRNTLRLREVRSDAVPRLEALFLHEMTR